MTSTGGTGGGRLDPCVGPSGWFAQTSDTTEPFYSVHLVDTKNGWMVGDNGTIRKTTDGGANWAPQTSGTSEGLRGVYAADAMTSWAVGESGA